MEVKYIIFDEISPFTEEDMAAIIQRTNAIHNALRVSRDDLGAVSDVNSNSASTSLQLLFSPLIKKIKQKPRGA